MQTSLKLRLAAVAALGAITLSWAPPKPPKSPAARNASRRRSPGAVST